MSVVSQEFLDINGLSRYDELIKERIPNLIPLTQAQYNALSTTEKNDPDKYYFIKDSAIIVNVNVLNDLSDINITNPAEDEILAYDSINQKWVNKVNRGGVTSFNGRSGSILPVAGDYNSTQVSHNTTSNVSTYLGVWTTPVACAVGAETCTIIDSNIHTTSTIRAFSETISGDVISCTSIAVTEGQAVITFQSALEEVANIKLQILNI